MAARVAGVMYAASVDGADFAMEVRADVFRPGREPGMADDEVADITWRALRFQGPGSALAGPAGPSFLISAWGEDEWREGVILTCARGAIPAVVKGLRRVAAASPAMDPGLAGAAVQAAGAARWMKALCPLVRLCAGPIRGAGRGWAECHMRFTEAALWLVRTGGTTCCGEVARSMGRAVRAAVSSAPVDAYDAQTDILQAMVLVRASPESNPRMCALVDAEGGLRIGARRFAVFPYTHGRGLGAGGGPCVTDSDLLHAAARRGHGRPAGAMSFALVVDRCGVDASGRPLPGAETRATCLRRGAGHAARPAAASWAHAEWCNHGYIRTRIEAWVADAGDSSWPDPGDAPPPTPWRGEVKG